MIPLPKELPELRQRQVNWLTTRFAGPLLRDPEATVTSTAPSKYAIAEAATWIQAELFHIAPSMVELVMQAKEGIGDAGFMPFDLPAPFGVAVFGMPLSSKRIKPQKHVFTEAELAMLRDEGHIPEHELDGVRAHQDIVWDEHLAVSWADDPPADEYPNGRVRMTWWQERHAWFDVNRAQGDLLRAYNDDAKPARVDDLAASGIPLGDYLPDGMTSIEYGAESADMTVLHHNGCWAADARTDMFRALCYLLRQRIAQETVVGPDRAARRRMAREGTEPQPVRLISLRGASASGGGDGSREFVHRWIVRGHWRRQWYRSIHSHRPIWISPFVKGPEDAPMLGGQKVYTASAPVQTSVEATS